METHTKYNWLYQWSPRFESCSPHPVQFRRGARSVVNGGKRSSRIKRNGYGILRNALTPNKIINSVPATKVSICRKDGSTALPYGFCRTDATPPTDTLKIIPVRAIIAHMPKHIDSRYANQLSFISSVTLCGASFRISFVKVMLKAITPVASVSSCFVSSFADLYPSNMLTESISHPFSKKDKLDKTSRGFRL